MNQEESVHDAIDQNDKQTLEIAHEDIPKQITESSKSKFIQILATLQYSFSYLIVGALLSALGWSNVILADYTRVDLHTMGWVFTARGSGWIVGSLASGKYYDVFKNPKRWYHLSGHKLLFVSSVLTAVLLAIVPISNQFWGLVVCYFFVGCFGGCLEVGDNLFTVWIWGEKVNAWLQFEHFGFGVGALLSPFIAAQLMSDDPKNYTGMRIAHWILAGVALLSGIGFAVLKTPDPTSEPEPTPEVEEKKKKWSISREMQVGILMAIFLALYVGAEIGFAGLIYDYVHMKELASPKHAAYLTSGFWGALTIGRLISIPLTSYLSLRTIILFDMVGCFLGLAIFFIFQTSIVATWIGTVILGLFMSSLFPSGIAFPKIYLGMETSGKITGVMVIGTDIHGIISYSC